MARFKEILLSEDAADRQATVAAALEVLRSGGVLAHPTSTVYGLGGEASPEVDGLIGFLKGRSVTAEAPLLRLMDGVEAVRRSVPAATWDARAARLADRFWPGPLTLVLPDGSGGSVAVRVEGHRGMRDILKAWGRPMTSTSLNRSGRPAAVTTAQARAVIESMPDVGVAILLLAAGDLGGPPPSTLVSLLTPEVEILREGAVSSREIRNCLDEVGRR